MCLGMAFWVHSCCRGIQLVFSSLNMTVSFQNSVDAAKPLLRKAIQISQQTPYWHCRLLFQLAVRTVGLTRCPGAGWVGGSLGWAFLAAVEEPAGQVD